MININVEIKTPVVQDMDTEYNNRYIIKPLIDVPDGQLVEIEPYYGTIKNKGTALNKAYFDTIRNDLIALANAISTNNSVLLLRADFSNPTNNRGQKLDISNYNFTNIDIVKSGDTWSRCVANLPQDIKKIRIKWYVGFPTNEYTRSVQGITSPNKFRIIIDDKLVVEDDVVKWSYVEDIPNGYIEYIPRYEGERIIDVKSESKIEIQNRDFVSDKPGTYPFFSIDIEVIK